MGTSVRDLAGLALHALPPRSRSRQRHGSALGRSRAPVRSGSRRRSSSPSCSLTEKTRSTEPAAIRWHARFAYETNNVDIRESVAVLALLTAIPANDWQPQRWPSSSAGGEASSDAPRHLFPGRGRRKSCSSAQRSRE
jgi:hypothetical protein